MTRPTTALARIGGFSRRLGAQAAMSAIVMTGLHVAAVNGYDPRQWLEPDAPAIAAPSREAPRVVGVPARFDPPVQAGGAIEQLSQRALEDAESFGPAAPRPAMRPRTAAAPRVAERATSPVPARVAVPSPRPAEPKPVTMAMRDAPDELPFDVPMRDDVRPVELVSVLDEVPMPPETEDRFTLGSIVPSGSAIIEGAGALTGTAAGVVTGATSRVFGLLR